MAKLRQILITAMANFIRWPQSPQIWLGFGLGFIACFLLSEKVADFAAGQDTLLQLFEPFIWTFGDANSILLISLCLLLVFADLPRLGDSYIFFAAASLIIYLLSFWRVRRYSFNFTGTER